MNVTVRGIVCAAVLAALAPGTARAQGFGSGLVTVGCAVVELIRASQGFPGASQGQAQNLLDEAVAIVASARIVRISVSFSCVEADADSFLPTISPRGDHIAYTSRATNLIPGDANGRADIYAKQIKGGAVTRLSIAPGGPEADGDSGSESLAPSWISGDLPREGRFATFSSAATNLTGDDANGAVPDVFLADRDADDNGVLDETATAENPAPVTIRRITRDFGGDADQGGYDSAVSEDGTIVAFNSVGSGVAKMFAFDAAGPSSSEIAQCLLFGDQVVPPPPPGFAKEAFLTSAVAISADGNAVAFVTDQALVAQDMNGFPDVYLYERGAAKLTRVSVPDPNAQTEFGTSEGNGASFDPAISADGKFVVFASAASNLVGSDSFGRLDTNGVADVFRYDGGNQQVARVNVTPYGDQAYGGDSRHPSVDASGNFVAFESDAVTMNPYPTGDNNGYTDIYLRDMRGGPGSLNLITFSSGGSGLADGPSRNPRISQNGNVVVFETDASNLIPFDQNGATDVLLADNPNN